MMWGFYEDEHPEGLIEPWGIWNVALEGIG